MNWQQGFQSLVCRAPKNRVWHPVPVKKLRRLLLYPFFLLYNCNRITFCNKKHPSTSTGQKYSTCTSGLWRWWVEKISWKTHFFKIHFTDQQIGFRESLEPQDLRTGLRKSVRSLLFDLWTSEKLVVLYSTLRQKNVGQPIKSSGRAYVVEW